MSTILEVEQAAEFLSNRDWMENEVHIPFRVKIDQMPMFRDDSYLVVDGILSWTDIHFGIQRENEVRIILQNILNGPVLISIAMTNYFFSFGDKENSWILVDRIYNDRIRHFSEAVLG